MRLKLFPGSLCISNLKKIFIIIIPIPHKEIIPGNFIPDNDLIPYSHSELGMDIQMFILEVQSLWP